MKKLYAVLLSPILLFSAGLSCAQAESEFSGNVYAGINSMYLWRGFNLSEDSDFVVQPGLDLSYAGFTASIWANYDEDSSKFNETDLTLDYSFDINETVSMSVGNTYFNLDAAEDTNELYLTCAFNTLLSPEFSIYWDWDQSEETGIYLTAGLSHSFELMDGLTLNLGGLVGYNIENYSVSEEYSNFHNAELSASIDWVVAGSVTITPAVTVSMPLTDDAEDIAGIDDETMVGLTASFEF
ncbi:MAG: hypothetical protein EHM86_04695 [Desulfobulbaceae bacterium]|nr:MAG: hypothetical protein EHM86_04695 [Desulfobulbaceae bacterium]